MEKHGGKYTEKKLSDNNGPSLCSSIRHIIAEMFNGDTPRSEAMVQKHGSPGGTFVQRGILYGIPHDTCRGMPHMTNHPWGAPSWDIPRHDLWARTNAIMAYPTGGCTPWGVFITLCAPRLDPRGSMSWWV